MDLFLSVKWDLVFGTDEIKLRLTEGILVDRMI